MIALLILKVFTSIVTCLSIQHIPSLNFISNSISNNSTDTDRTSKRVGKDISKVNFNDEKLVYIYENRHRLHVCEEDSKEDISPYTLFLSKAASKVYQIGDKKYIVEFLCMNGRDHFYEFLLYSKTNYGIEIKMLPLLSRIGDKEGGGNDTNGQTVWIYRRITNATPRFDPERLILKVDAVHNGQGYKTEYVFENNEFKLTKFTKLSIHMRTNPETQKYELVQESEDIYP